MLTKQKKLKVACKCCLLALPFALLLLASFTLKPKTENRGGIILPAGFVAISPIKKIACKKTDTIPASFPKNQVNTITTTRVFRQYVRLTLSGISQRFIHISQIKKIKELKCIPADYAVLSATVNFSGEGFPKIITADLSGASFKSVEAYFNKIVSGSIVRFENVIVEKKDSGKIKLRYGGSFRFYDKQEELDRLNDDKVFTKAEYDAYFKGGDKAWQDYLGKNLDTKMPASEGWKAGTYTILVRFIVDKDGTVSDVKTDDFPNSKTARQCIDLIKKGPKWKPAMQNGQIVKAYRKQPITFVVEKQ